VTVFPPITSRYRVKRQGSMDYLAGASSVEVAFASAARRSHQEPAVLWMVVDTNRSVVIALAESGHVKTTEFYEDGPGQAAAPSKTEDAERLAVRLMAHHGLLALGWRFEFDRASRRFGYCNYKRKVISLSRPLTLLNDVGEVRNTILHEIAHALLPPKTGHSAAWRELAISIGCDGKRLHSAKTEAKWIATCPACGNQVKYRRRRSKFACARCCKGLYDSRFNFTWLPIEKASDERQ
jgi:predicted SprT family Zn-dependent metalloprotease